MGIGASYVKGIIASKRSYTVWAKHKISKGDIRMKERTILYRHDDDRSFACTDDNMAGHTCEEHPHGSVNENLVEVYHDDLMGIPLILVDSIYQTVCEECGVILSTTIPNQEELIAAVAVLRINDPLKLNGAEIKFLRKALGKTAKELADALEVTSTTVSRWENGKDPIGPTSEKLLRLIVGDELCESAPAIDFDPAEIVHMRIQPVRLHDEFLPIIMKLGAETPPIRN